VPALVAGPPEYSLVGALREHFVDRAVSGMHHVQPWWYYAEVLPMDLLPWSGLVPGAVLLAWRRRAPGDRLLLVWVAFVVLFFSVSTEKRDLYVLPAWPAFALLVGSFLRRWAPGGEGAPPARGWATVPLGITGGLLVAVGAVLPLAARRLEVVSALGAGVTAAALVAGGAAALAAAWRGRPLGAAAATAGGIAAAYVLAAGLVLPALDPLKSARAFSVRIRDVTADARAAGGTVPAWRLGNLPEAFSFYTRGVYLPEISSPADLARHLDRPERAYAVVDADEFDLLPADVRRRVVEVERARLSRTDVALVTNAPQGASAETAVEP